MRVEVQVPSQPLLTLEFLLIARQGWEFWIPARLPQVPLWLGGVQIPPYCSRWPLLILWVEGSDMLIGGRVESCLSSKLPLTLSQQERGRRLVTTSWECKYRFPTWSPLTQWWWGWETCIQSSLRPLWWESWCTLSQPDEDENPGYSFYVCWCGRVRPKCSLWYLIGKGQ